MNKLSGNSGDERLAFTQHSEDSGWIVTVNLDTTRWVNFYFRSQSSERGSGVPNDVIDASRWFQGLAEPFSHRLLELAEVATLLEMWDCYPEFEANLVGKVPDADRERQFMNHCLFETVYVFYPYPANLDYRPLQDWWKKLPNDRFVYDLEDSDGQQFEIYYLVRTPFGTRELGDGYIEDCPDDGFEWPVFPKKRSN